MTTTDTIVLALSVFYLARGFARGFIRSVMFPAAFVLATIISIIYYQITLDFILSLFIALIGPFILYFVLVLLLKFFNKASFDDTEPSFISRVAGAFLSLAWIWTMIIPAIILLAIMPANNKFLMKMHRDLKRSVTYQKTAFWSNGFLPITSSAMNKTEGQGPSPTDLQSMADDPRFKKVLQDPEIQQEIAHHDMAKLMSNPKMMQLTQEIMSDPRLLKKLLATWRNQTQSLQPQETQ